jgi:hypothetical protein
VQVWILSIAVLTSTGHNPVTQWNALASPHQVYFGRVFSLSSTRFNSSSFCAALGSGGKQVFHPHPQTNLSNIAPFVCPLHVLGKLLAFGDALVLQ